MKVLFIGGTGNISTVVSRLAIERGIELYHLNRGNRKVEIAGVKTITGDITKKEDVAAALAAHRWDAVVNWIAFNPADIERDLELFRGRTKQYIFISSASAYQKPPLNAVITESTPLKNPFWEYSRLKIACEERLNRAYRDEDFPMTIVRPSHTYDTVIPVAIGGWTDYSVVERMRKGKPVVVHGDGTSLWTLTHAEDFSKGFVGLLGHRQAIGHAFHITSDEALSWDQIYYTLADAAGVEAKIVHIPSEFIAKVEPSRAGSLLGDKAVCAVFDNTKIKTFVPDFKATIPFSKGIRKTLAWFDADPARRVAGQGDGMIEKLLAAWDKALNSI